MENSNLSSPKPGSNVTTPVSSTVVRSGTSSTTPIKLGVEDFLYGQVLGEGSYAKVLYCKLQSKDKVNFTPASSSHEGERENDGKTVKQQQVQTQQGKKLHDEYFAVKMMDKRHIKKEGKTMFVMIERNVLLHARHPNIVKLFFSFQDTDSLFYVLEMCEYGDLLHLLRHCILLRKGSSSSSLRLSIPKDETHVNSRSPVLSSPSPIVPMNLIKHILAQIVCALEYLHTHLGVVHRDMKPENILLHSAGIVKLTDFGSALEEGVSALASNKYLEKIHTVSTPSSVPIQQLQKEFVGTAEYVSPELLRDEGAHAPSDLWGLGCIAYQLIAGKPPFQGASEYLTFQKILAYNPSLNSLKARGTAEEADLSQPSPQIDDVVGTTVDSVLVSPDSSPRKMVLNDSRSPRESRAASIMSAMQNAQTNSAGLMFPGMYFDPTSVEFITKLLQPNPGNRLGVVSMDKKQLLASSSSSDGALANNVSSCGDVVLDYGAIKGHSFFSGIDWSTVSSMSFITDETRALFVKENDPRHEPSSSSPYIDDDEFFESMLPSPSSNIDRGLVQGDIKTRSVLEAAGGTVEPPRIDVGVPSSSAPTDAPPVLLPPASSQRLPPIAPPRTPIISAFSALFSPLNLLHSHSHTTKDGGQTPSKPFSGPHDLSSSSTSFLSRKLSRTSTSTADFDLPSTSHSMVNGGGTHFDGDELEGTGNDGFASSPGLKSLTSGGTPSRKHSFASVGSKKSFRSMHNKTPSNASGGGGGHGFPMGAVTYYRRPGPRTPPVSPLPEVVVFPREGEAPVALSVAVSAPVPAPVAVEDEATPVADPPILVETSVATTDSPAPSILDGLIKDDFFH
jgi:serine/threonine protein kinase